MAPFPLSGSLLLPPTPSNRRPPPPQVFSHSISQLQCTNAAVCIDNHAAFPLTPRRSTNVSIAPVVPRQKCPYLDTVNRTYLDFDFEKVCSSRRQGTLMT